MRMLHEVNNVLTGDGTTQHFLGITIRIPGGGFNDVSQRLRLITHV